MKLHLGCGKKKWDEYVNCDLKDSDLDCDIRFLPFDSDSAEEIVAIHVLEHFWITEVENVLRGWYNVLKTDGRLILELPCFDKVADHISMGSPDNFTRWALFGDPRTHIDGLPALHKWCYKKSEIYALLKLVGFKEVYEEEPKFHQPSRDMRFIAIK